MKKAPINSFFLSIGTAIEDRAPPYLTEGLGSGSAARSSTWITFLSEKADQTVDRARAQTSPAWRGNRQKRAAHQAVLPDETSRLQNGTVRQTSPRKCEWRS